MGLLAICAAGARKHAAIFGVGPIRENQGAVALGGQRARSAESGIPGAAQGNRILVRDAAPQGRGDESRLGKTGISRTDWRATAQRAAKAECRNAGKRRNAEMRRVRDRVRGG